MSATGDTKAEALAKGQARLAAIGTATLRGAAKSALLSLDALKACCLVTDRGCWEWQFARNPDGYGQICDGGKPERVHRLAYAHANGPIPEGTFVLHRCDNPPCCNPEHLFLGDNSVNMQDRYAKGRHRTGKRANRGKGTRSRMTASHFLANQS